MSEEFYFVISADGCGDQHVNVCLRGEVEQHVESAIELIEEQKALTVDDLDKDSFLGNHSGVMVIKGRVIEPKLSWEVD